MSDFEGLDGLPELDISEETSKIIKTGASMAQACRTNADKALLMANKIEDFAHLFRRLGLAYQQTAKRIIDEVGETIDMEWGGDDPEEEDSQDS